MGDDLLKSRLCKISKIFNISKILNTKLNLDTVKNYYLKNKWAYTFFHSKDNFVHLGISEGKVFTKSDYYAQAKFIGRYIKNNKNFNVLELATGRGANCKYLAKLFPYTKFTGIDISPSQLFYANKVSSDFKNYAVVEGDFHNLKQFNKNSQDLVFVIESLCHSKNKLSVLEQVYKILKPGGYFIVIDGYLNRKNLSLTEKKAFKLTEVCMAIGGDTTYNSFKKEALSSWFTLDYEEDVSDKVIPSMQKLEKLAKMFFKYSIISRLLKSLLPVEVTLNSITAYLWVPLTKSKVVGYYITVLKKS